MCVCVCVCTIVYGSMLYISFTCNDYRGKGISAETEQLDAVMFGSAHGPAHPVTVTVSQLETRITEARQALDGIASSLLSKSRQCLSFHLLRHRCDSLTSALGTLTSSTTQLPPIGHSLPSASSALQRHTENNQRLEVSGGWVYSW